MSYGWTFEPRCFFRQGVELPPLRQRGASETPTTQRAGESDAEL